MLPIACFLLSIFLPFLSLLVCARTQEWYSEPLQSNPTPHDLYHHNSVLKADVRIAGATVVANPLVWGLLSWLSPPSYVTPSPLAQHQLSPEQSAAVLQPLQVQQQGGQAIIASVSLLGPQIYLIGDPRIPESEAMGVTVDMKVWAEMSALGQVSWMLTVPFVDCCDISNPFCFSSALPWTSLISAL